MHDNVLYRVSSQSLRHDGVVLGIRTSMSELAIWRSLKPVGPISGVKHVLGTDDLRNLESRRFIRSCAPVRRVPCWPPEPREFEQESH
jgi:hypothetical protein